MNMSTPNMLCSCAQARVSGLESGQLSQVVDMDQEIQGLRVALDALAVQQAAAALQAEEAVRQSAGGSAAAASVPSLEARLAEAERRIELVDSCHEVSGDGVTPRNIRTTFPHARVIPSVFASSQLALNVRSRWTCQILCV